MFLELAGLVVSYGKEDVDGIWIGMYGGWRKFDAFAYIN